MRSSFAASIALVCACTPPPPPKAPAKLTMPIVFDALELRPTPMAQLRFECGRAHEGLDLRVALVDARGRMIEAQDLRFGRIFGGDPLGPGRVVRRPIEQAAEATLKVVGRARPVGTLRSRRLDAVELAGIKLVDGQSCVRARSGELDCSQLADPRIARTLRLERVMDPARAVLRLGVTFNRDFEHGVAFEALLIDERGVVHPRCRLRIKQPQVFEAQHRRYTLPLRGQASVAVLATVRRLRVVGSRALSVAEQDGTHEVRLFCVPRPRVRPRATIH